MLYRLIIINFLIIAFMMSCALPPPVPDAVVTDRYSGSPVDEVFQNINAQYTAAKRDGVDLFAAGQFKLGMEALAKAASLRKSNAKDMHILKQLYTAEKQLNVCRQVKAQAEQRMPEVLAALQTLREKSAMRSYAYEYDSMRYKTSKLLSVIEDGVMGRPVKSNNDFARDKAELMAQLRALEIKVVKYNTLNDSNIVFQQAKSLGGRHLAPQTFRQAEQALQAANEIIEEKVKDQAAIDAAGKTFQFAVFHALHLARDVNKLDSLSGAEYEEYILQLENKLQTVAEAFGYKDIRRHTIDEQIELLTALAIRSAAKREAAQVKSVALAEDTQEVSHLKKELAKALQKIQEQSDHISLLQADQSPVAAAVSMDERKMKRKVAQLEQQVAELLLQYNNLKAERDSLRNKLNAKR